MRLITLIPGDGIGPEVTQSAREVVTAAGANVSWDIVGAGMQTGKQQGTPLPASVFESIARTRLALKGPVQTPFGDDYPVRVERGTGPRIYPSVTIALRKELKLFVNVRPARNYPGVKSRFDNVDLLIFRENSEDLYAGRERMVDADTAEAIKIITRQGSERVARFAFDYMRKVGRRKLSVIHKSNVMKLTDGLFLRTAQEVASDYPEFEVNQRVVDALCMELVIRPEEFDCLLLPNLYGDIVSDLAAGLVGGLGVAPGANIGPDCAMFEAVHGSAPDIGGKDIANPMAMVLSAVMLLRYIGEAQAADRVEQALTAVLRDKKHVTRDLGGSAGTREMTAAIIRNLSGSSPTNS
jgi:isocitrate dehydrogenase (NAD+)